MTPRCNGKIQLWHSCHPRTDMSWSNRIRMVFPDGRVWWMNNGYPDWVTEACTTDRTQKLAVRAIKKLCVAHGWTLVFVGYIDD